MRREKMRFECGEITPALIGHEPVGGVGVATDVIGHAPWFCSREFKDASFFDGGGYLIASTGLSLQISDDRKRAGCVRKFAANQDYNGMIIHERLRDKSWGEHGV
jgi:hypothetical protein